MLLVCPAHTCSRVFAGSPLAGKHESLIAGSRTAPSRLPQAPLRLALCLPLAGAHRIMPHTLDNIYLAICSWPFLGILQCTYVCIRHPPNHRLHVSHIDAPAGFRSAESIQVDAPLLLARLKGRNCLQAIHYDAGHMHILSLSLRPHVHSVGRAAIPAPATSGHAPSAAPPGSTPLRPPAAPSSPFRGTFYSPIFYSPGCPC